MKKILIIFLALISFNAKAFAENIAVKITPDQTISTCYDEIEIGDSIKFKTVYDVYLRDKLYIAKNSPIIGIVDYVNDNGWSFDNAQVDFKIFKTKNVNGNAVTIETPLSIDGFEILKYKGNRKAQFFNYIGVVFRGKEIEIIPGVDDVQYTIWLPEK